ncbi:HD domain-containing phosphohydrolase [Kaarinaea lacus]
MAQQQVTLGHGIESRVINEFVAEYNEAHAEIETLLLTLENNPNDEDLLNDLFRKVHSIKGNAHFMGLDVIADFVHALENILDKMRKHDLLFDKLLGDVVLHTIDHVGFLCNNLRTQQSVDTSLTLKIQDQLQQLASAGQYNLPQHCQHVIDLYQGNLSATAKAGISSLGVTNNVNLVSEELEDLRFFSQIIESAERRSPFWNGRSQRLLNIALEMNKESGSKVDSEQLEAAVYLHDFGMAFLPLNLLHKGEKLTEEEFRSVQLHARMGAALLGDNTYWLQATEIIIQHHEREDGKGYPNRLTGDHICDGAKILAIADAFEAMTNQRANRAAKLSFSQAIKEINQNAGSQFSVYWVKIFNDVIRNKTRKTDIPSK